MKLLTLSISACVLAAVVFAGQAKPVKSDATWTKDLNAAFVKAKKTGKKVFVDFNATWCGPCQLYKKNVFPTKEFKAATKNMILVEIDIDEQPEIARKFNVGSIPDLRIFKADSTWLDHMVGYAGPNIITRIQKASKVK